MTNAASETLSADQQEIQTVIGGYRDAWNRHDMKAMADLFAEEAEWVNIVGMHWPGKRGVVGGHEAYHRTFFRETEIELADVAIRAIAPGVVVAVIRLKVDAFTPPDGVRRPPSDNRLSLVLTHRGGRWLIAHGHNTVVDAGAQRFDPVRTRWPDKALDSA